MSFFRKVASICAAIAIVLTSTLASAGAANASDIGVVWENGTLPQSVNGLETITFGNGIFVGANFSGDILRSTDGKNWVPILTAEQGDFGPIAWRAASFGNNAFVILGSENAKTWVSRSTDSGLTYSDPVVARSTWGFDTLAFGNNAFVATDKDNCGGRSIYSINGGQTWIDGARMVGRACQVGLAFGNNTFVSVSDGGTIDFSTDRGTSWNGATYVSGSAPHGNPFSDVLFNGSTFLTLYTENSATYVYTSTNGQEWSRVVASGISDSQGWSLGWDGSSWLAGAGGQLTGIFRSTDGINWIKVDDNNTQWRSFALGNQIIAVAGKPQSTTGSAGLNTTIAVGWSVGTNPPTPSPPTPVPPIPDSNSSATLPATGWNSQSFELPTLIASLMLALGVTAVYLVRRRHN